MDQSEINYIKIPYPHAKDLHCKIVVPKCSLAISPGIGNAWVTGQYHDPKEVIPISVRQVENIAEIIAVNAFAYRTPPRLLPHLKLSFGRSQPFSLSILSGEIADQFDFGGLPLSSLIIQYGGGDQSINFSYPNPQLMTRLKITADTGPVKIENIANANAAEIRLSGDSTRYQLIFSDEIKQNTSLHIGMAVSVVEISISPNMAVKILSNDPPGGSHKDDFLYANKAFWNCPARENHEPLLTIIHGASEASLRIQYI